MDELISRQAAIDVLEERLQANGYSNVALVSELNRSIGYLMQLPPAQPEHGQWILCNEQLPDKKGYYLTSDRFGVTITQWNGKGWVRTSVVTITEYGRSVHHEPPIMAWMPLPKPYGR